MPVRSGSSWQTRQSSFSCARLAGARSASVAAAARAAGKKTRKGCSRREQALMAVLPGRHPRREPAKQGYKAYK
ncbi:MAG: hypothetical protein Kow0062_01240 [Acidobacteriota bacterium]